MQGGVGGKIPVQGTNRKSIQSSSRLKFAGQGGRISIQGRGGAIDYETSPHVLQSSTLAIANMIQANSRSPNDFTMSFIISLLWEWKSPPAFLGSKGGAVAITCIFGHFQRGHRQI